MFYRICSHVAVHRDMEQSLMTIDLIELTIHVSNNTIDQHDSYLSLLRLPSIFNENLCSLVTTSHTSMESKRNDNDQQRLSSMNGHVNINRLTTISSYISKLNEHVLINDMFGYDAHYSKNILHIMKCLVPKLSQPYFIYELDFEVTSFFRYIRWKMFNVYWKHTKDIRMLVERMFSIVQLNVSIDIVQQGMHRSMF
jgi:hypothetical protein